VTATVTLTRSSLRTGVRELAARDHHLAGIVARFGEPPLFDRPAGFATLVWIILEQQVSLASAKALFAKLQVATGGPITADAVSRITPDGLHSLGFTRQKARYVSGLATRTASGDFGIDALANLTDAEAETALLDIPGIGPWTAGITFPRSMNLVPLVAEAKRHPSRQAYAVNFP
jgi:DNA-3-methyladenine glycosylase II